MLLLTPAKGGSKSEFVVKNKFLHIFVTDEASDFKFGMPLGFPRRIIKSHQKRKWVWLWARGAPRNLGLPL